ncbi:MAG: trypsin-like peptidase domain-containing protein [Pseudomonadota bacterium]|nr:trypsin-like peptidase domain-containing protein [Pseudomonadota bacterium]
MHFKRHVLWTAFAATLALSACGGSDDDSGDTPAPTPAPPAASSDRIEPLDTATLRQAAADKAQPEAASRLPAGAVPAQVALGPLPVVKAATPESKGAPMQVGEGRAVPATADAAQLASLLRWSALADGTQVAAVRFAAEGANGLRLGVRADRVPEGAVLRFYGDRASPVVEMGAAELAALRQANEQAGVASEQARMVWSPSIDGAQATLEVQLPAGVTPDALALAVPELSHLLLTAQQAMDAPPKNTNHIGRAGSCNLDVTCNSNLDTESRAVAKMMYTRSGSTYLCTGTLLNDAKNSQTPYFLTAAHCVSEQAVASTLETYWFFRAASCNSTPQFDSRATRMTGGATLLFANSTVDTALLRLNAQPPANVVYAGSYFGPGAVANTAVLGVHHPAGDLQKYSLGGIAGFVSCSSSGNCTESERSSSDMFVISWSNGTTEGGSSGSALFAQSGNTRYVIGALNGGSASCSNPNGIDLYGRFERAYAMGIQRWLNP